MNPSEIEKRRSEILDIGMAIIHLWLKNPEKTLSWVIEEINKKS